MEALSPRNLELFYPSLKQIVERLFLRWTRAAWQQKPFDMLEDLKRFTVDVTTLLAFGHDARAIDDGNDLVRKLLELVFPVVSDRIFATVPTWRLIRSARDRRVERALAELRVWLGRLVARARERLAADPARAHAPSNFLEALLVARDERGEPISEELILGNAITILLAGEDTTAYSLAWTIHELFDSPDSRDALRCEAEQVLGGEVAPHDLAQANLLRWATAAGNEGMRLRPVAPFLALESITETHVGDVRLPAGTMVFVLFRPATRDPKHFAEPETFRPARWIAGEQSGPHEAGMHMPFGSGPRLCPGRSLAMLEMKLVLAMLHAHFDVERDEGAGDVHERFAMTMRPTELRVRLRPRF
jgi:cytochrome P450